MVNGNALESKSLLILCYTHIRRIWYIFTASPIQIFGIVVVTITSNYEKCYKWMKRSSKTA
jgi:hypothetical protein